MVGIWRYVPSISCLRRLSQHDSRVTSATGRVYHQRLRLTSEVGLQGYVVGDGSCKMIPIKDDGGRMGIVHASPVFDVSHGSPSTYNLGLLASLERPGDQRRCLTASGQ